MVSIMATLKNDWLRNFATHPKKKTVRIKIFFHINSYELSEWGEGGAGGGGLS